MFSLLRYLYSKLGTDCWEISVSYQLLSTEVKLHNTSKLTGRYLNHSFSKKWVIVFWNIKTLQGTGRKSKSFMVTIITNVLHIHCLTIEWDS